MAPRFQLQQLLEDVLGTENVYFQPPANVLMTYPCIVYHRDSANILHADNYPYNYTKRYRITVIDQDPDSPFPDKVGQLPLCTFDRFFTADNLNHDVFTLFF